MMTAKRIVFIGTSFSVNITQMALTIAMQKSTAIDIVDPNPVVLNYSMARYHPMTASEFIDSVDNGNIALT